MNCELWEASFPPKIQLISPSDVFMDSANREVSMNLMVNACVLECLDY